MLTHQFACIDKLLAEHRPFWQFRAFDLFEPPWPSGLVACLTALQDSDVVYLDTHLDALTALLLPWLPEAKSLHLLCEAIPGAALDDQLIDERLGVGLPGRKWAQIKAFANLMPLSCPAVLEWCAGKGHLGRVFAHLGGRSVTSLEWDQGLCDQGVLLARKHQVTQTFVCVDALSSEALRFIPNAGTSVALHACGDLHRALIEGWAKGGKGELMVAPCCYHLIADDQYQPFSQQAKGAQVQFSKPDLSLPLQATVTGGQRALRLRDQEALWRLSFDLFQRQLRGVNEYLPLPNLQKQLLSGSFEDFLTWAAAKKGLTLPVDVDAPYWLARGQQRLAQVRRFELVGKLFRRALELWLVLDRALFLQEQGAEVKLNQFCDYAITPRNFLITAHFNVQAPCER